MSLEAWESWARIEKGLADTTVTAYRRELRRLGHGLETLATEDLREKLHAAGGAPATVARRVAAWRSFYYWMVRTDQRDDDPTAKLDRPKVVRGLPRPVENLVDILGRLEPTFQSVAVFLVETGLRISEAMAVDVELPAPKELIVKGKGSKERLVPLTDVAREALAELGGSIPVSARQVQAKFREVGITPHRLRHTLATELARKNVDLSVIQDILGHASPATTRIYQRNDPTRLREGLERRSA